MSKMNEIKDKLTKLQTMNAQYLSKISSIIQERAFLSDQQIMSYFTYSLSLAHHRGRENFCIGSYHIYNIGGKPIHNPYICIKLPPSSPFEFSGKYVYKDSKQTMKFANSWERINDSSDKEEFWLKPHNTPQLKPFQKLTFSDFQIKWTTNHSYTGSVLAFTYGDDMKEGIASLNQISINGTLDEEDFDD